MSDKIEGPIGTIVFGPGGCGKSHNAELFKATFGRFSVIEDWNGTDRLPANALVLVSVDPRGRFDCQGFEVLSFDEAMQLAKGSAGGQKAAVQ